VNIENVYADRARRATPGHFINDFAPDKPSSQDSYGINSPARSWISSSALQSVWGSSATMRSLLVLLSFLVLVHGISILGSRGNSAAAVQGD